MPMPIHIKESVSLQFDIYWYPLPNTREIHRPTIMSPDGEVRAHLSTLCLDGTFLELGPKEEAFFKAETGIQDAEELRKHIIEVQEEAYKVSSWSRGD